ncbi:MAG TPA: S1 RNA-binding domain-containing protein [Coleofasciculaceae cyanobacterium]|jgi:ribosomal protein S1
MTTLLETSEEMRQSFADLLEKSFETNLKTGSIVVGEILKMEKDGLTVDIGGKSEGFIPMKEIPACYSLDELKNTYHVGQVAEFFLLHEQDSNDDSKAHYVLSIRRVNMWKNWDRLLELRDSKEIVETTVTGTTKGGVIVNIMGFKGFIPASQLRVAKTLHDLIGDVLPAKILEVDKHKNKLILSHREAVFEQKALMRAETIGKLTEGDVVEGEIVKITDFGVFVDINGIDGLLPLSEITWRRIQHPSEVLTLGERLTVRVLTVDRNLQRISLSLKRLQPDPWESVNENFKVGQMLNGRISKLLGSGVLAELAPGVEAYCAYNNEGRQYFLNETYHFKIVSIYAADRKITLEYQGPQV